MIEKYVVKLDFHRARWTGAKTEWKIFTDNGEWLTIEEAEKRGWIRKIYSTASGAKTHWYEFWEITETAPFLWFVRIRVTSRGNVSKYRYYAAELRVAPEELP